ncbi:hypothetical protein Efla_003082 [Eimeria flavescens]
MFFQCDSERETSFELLKGASLVHTLDTDIADRPSSCQPTNFVSGARGAGSTAKSHLESFLHFAPVHCIEAVARFLDLSSFVVLLSLNTSLLRLCDSSALLPCWTHFALVQRILRHGENVLLPPRSPTSVLPLPGGLCGNGARGGARGNGQNVRHEDLIELFSPSQTFSRMLPSVTRLDLVRIGSLNSNWRSKNFSSEQRQVISCGETLDKAYVLPAPPFVSSFNEFSVAPDAQLNLQACPSVGQPACLQPVGHWTFADVDPIFTLLPSMHIFATHAAPRSSRDQSVEIKLPLLPGKISRDPEPLIKFGGYAPKGWLLGEHETAWQAATGGSTASARSVGRVSQSQRKRQQRQQRQQQLHRLHISWVHVAPHPLRPCLQDGARGEATKCPSREGSPLLSSAPPPFRLNTQSHLSAGDSSTASAADAGLGHCPVVRLLCICLPSIEVENSSALTSSATERQSYEGKKAEATDQAMLDVRQIGEGHAAETAAVPNPCSSSITTGAPTEAQDAAQGAGSTSLTACSVGQAETLGVLNGPPSPLLPSAVALNPPVTPTPPRRIWPVAVCSYSSKGSRFLAHAIVCCALREGETVKCARSRLWYKAKGPKKILRCGTSRKTVPYGNEDTQATCVSTAVSEARHLSTQNEAVTNASNSIRVVSFSMQHHPLAFLVGIVAVGTSEGRILCTPPPLCLVRRCYCGKGCVGNRSTGATGSSAGGPSSCSDAQAGSASVGRPQTGYQKLDSFGRTSANVQQEQRAFAVPAGGSTSANSIAQTAAKAGCGVAFEEVGDFGERGGAVDYVELVRGIPWAPRAQRREQPQLLVPTQQRDFSWHWSRVPTVAAADPVASGVSTYCDSVGKPPCGGLEAEALWMFACSKEVGLKIFRYIWGFQDRARGGVTSSKSSAAEASCGEWKCVFTVRGSCQLVSLDLNNGVLALCTSTDSRVYFLCFKHLLPAHIYMANAAESTMLHAADLAQFGSCRLPRPQQVPLGGYLAVPQQQFTSLLQSPAECARFELLVAKRPSFLQPLGGCRWVVIDGAVIRVVQVLVKDATAQRRPLDQERRQTLLATLTGSPLEQLRQLRRRVFDEPELPWVLSPPPAPELQAVRLCVFSHPRTIYHCAFDGVRRLVTVDLRELLMVWDLQRYTKLCGIDLLASGDSRRRSSSCSEEAECCDGDGADLGASSDGLCSDHEAYRSSLSKRGTRAAGQTEGVKVNSARAARKLARHNLKRQFGREWLQKHVLAHRNNSQHNQGYSALHSSPQASATSAAGAQAMPVHGERVSVGGMWFSSSALEPALQLQLLYDLQRGVGNARASASPSADCAEHAGRGSSGTVTGTVGAMQIECAEASTPENIEETAESHAGVSEPQSTQVSLVDNVVHEPGGGGKFENEKQNLPTAVAGSYADDFPPLILCTETKGDRKRYHSVHKASRAASIQHPAASAPCTAPPTSEKMLSPNTSAVEVLVTSALGSSKRSWRLNEQAPKTEQQPAQPEAAERTSANGGERPSFAAVVAAAASSESDRCPRTGWSSGPVDLSVFIDMLGEEEARALQESAAAIGMSIEDFYFQQMAQWEQLQSRGRQRARAEEIFSRRAVHESNEEKDSGSRNRSSMASAARRQAGVTSDTVPQRERVEAQSGEHLSNAEAGEDLSHGSDADSTEISRSPLIRPLPDVLPSSSVRESASCHARPSQHPVPISPSQYVGVHLESRMVGLLGKQRRVARLGPNAQRRHVIAMCLSETSMALLYKNLKTWQIWTFTPSAGVASDSDDPSAE